MRRDIDESAERISRNRKVAKSVPMKKEWLELQDEIIDQLQATEEAVDKLEHLKKKFWVSVEEDLGYGDMRIDMKNKRIEILESATDAIVSDYED